MNQCVCAGSSLDRMLRPAVLTLLRDCPKGLHGYGIEQRLEEFQFCRRSSPDFTGLYRLLKKMEAEGLLRSAKSRSDNGPAKRVYALTVRGKQCMSRWRISLLNYRDMLDDLLDRMKNNASGEGT
jgi:DNA-binding PadR family transcriptional regulator